jgi:protein required for attachment to host cells
LILEDSKQRASITSTEPAIQIDCNEQRLKHETPSIVTEGGMLMDFSEQPAKQFFSIEVKRDADSNVTESIVAQQKHDSQRTATR